MKLLLRVVTWTNHIPRTRPGQAPQLHCRVLLFCSKRVGYLSLQSMRVIPKVPVIMDPVDASGCHAMRSCFLTNARRTHLWLITNHITSPHTRVFFPRPSGALSFAASHCICIASPSLLSPPLSV